MSQRLELKGIIPSPPVVYTDATCRSVDYDATREHLRFLMSHDISGLCVGGHAGETRHDEHGVRLDVEAAAWCWFTYGHIPL